jgi:type II secretory pathway pseudopilin PulG
MRLSGASGRMGFSLIEALVAAAILLTTCLTASALLVNALGAGRFVDRRAAVDEVLASERARLAVLPYYALTSAPADGAPWCDPEAPSLLAQVFPHALTGGNTTAASYRDDGDGAVFVTQRTLRGVDIRCEARFVRRIGSDWTVLPAASVSGWAIWRSGALPAAAVELRLRATAGTRSSSLQIRLGALSPAVEKAADSRTVDRAG